MKRTVVAAVAWGALGAAPALAADLPARVYTKAPAVIAAINDWSGFYIGANAGGGTARSCWTNASVVPNAGEGCSNATGAVAGGQVGYRAQAGAFVYGLEAQGNWAGFKGSNASQFIGGATNQTKVDSLGLFTGQVGYAWNNVLWYVKGGAAVTSGKYSGITTATGNVFDSGTDTRWGGVVGTGIELGITPNWSIAAEYDHLFMGSRNIGLTTVPAGAASRTDAIGQDVDMATVRVNYRWGGPVIGKY